MTKITTEYNQHASFLSMLQTGGVASETLLEKQKN